VALAALLHNITRPLGRRRGFTDATLISHWPTVVGIRLAAESMPERLVRRRDGSGATLHIRVDGPMALELQHLEPQVIERLNVFYGYNAVERIALRQAPVTRPSAGEKLVRPSPTAADARYLDDSLARVADPELKRALSRLGRNVLAYDRR